MEWEFVDDLLVVRMDDGEDLVETLGKFIGLPEVPETLVVLSGLGMLRQVELGYFTGKGYETHRFMEPAELLSVSGSIFKRADPFMHLHVLLGFKDASVSGGHLLRARVCNTLEIFLLGSSIRLGRKQAGDLRVLDLHPDG
jgi:hypothetical protein